MSVLELKNISYKYDGANKKVLSGINLSFKQGTLYAIMGKSGSGKTTLLSLLSGLDLPTDGEILYNGKDLKNLDRDEYRAKGIGVIFQGYRHHALHGGNRSETVRARIGGHAGGTPGGRL